MSRPLFTLFPELEAQVPLQPLAMLPTPVESLSIADNAYVKRDDLTHPEYGGNKIRKLEFIVAQARAQGATRIVSFGAIGTNHGVATAMVCNRFGLACTLYLFDQPVTATVEQNLRLMQYYEAELVYTGSLFNTVMAFYINRYRRSKTNYFLFAGGSNVTGTLGFVNAACELAEQVRQQEVPEPRVIVCPVGSSATLAGLTLGCRYAGLNNTQVKGVRVAPAKLGPFSACTEQTVFALMRQTHDFLQARVSGLLPEPIRPILMNQYFGAGYGVALDEGWAAQERLSHCGIKVEQTYTAKAAVAFLDELAATQEPVLYWHTFNSNDMSAQAGSINRDDLPARLRRFIVDQEEPDQD